MLQRFLSSIACLIVLIPRHLLAKKEDVLCLLQTDLALSAKTRLGDASFDLAHSSDRQATHVNSTSSGVASSVTKVDAVIIPILGVLVPVVAFGIAITRWSIAGETEGKGKIQWSVKVVVFLALFADFLLTTMPIPILPKALSCSRVGPEAVYENCVSDSLIFALFASKPAFQILANPFVAHLVDKLGPRFPLLMSLVIMAVSTAVFSFGLWLNDLGALKKLEIVYPILFSARAVQGIASSSAMCAGMTFVSIVHPREERGAATGFVMTGLALGVMCGPVLGGVIGQHVASWAGFLVVAALIAVGGVLQVAFLGDAEATEELDDNAMEDRDASYSSYTDPLVLIVGAGTVISIGAISMLEPLVPLYLSRDPFDMGSQNQGLVWSSATVAYIASTAVAGMLADHVPKESLLALGFLLLAIGVGIIMTVDLLWVTIVGLVFCGLSMGIVDTPSLPLLTDILDYRGSKDYGSAFAVADIATCLACMLGPMAASVATALNVKYKTLMWGVSLLSLVFIPVILRLRIVRSSGEEAEQHAQQLLRSSKCAENKAVRCLPCLQC